MSFVGELRRRNVVKVAVAYAIIGWLSIEIAATILPIFEAPNWIVQVFTFFVILGFPLALVLSWAYELTPDGMERTRSVPLPENITHSTGRKLDFAIIALLVIAVGYMFIDNYVLKGAPPAEAVAEDRRSIAVLPFDNRSAQTDDQFFVDGMHDDLLTQLARIASLKVISRTSVMSYRNTDKNMRTIGEELGVATILEGGVQRAGDSVRINVQLIDAATDEHIWAETYDRELNAGNIFAMQTAMATAIADALQASLSPEDVARLETVPTRNTRALDFYLSGNDYFNRPSDAAFKPLAVDMYQQAVAEDPEFALAWAALSRAHSTMYWYAVDSTTERLNLAEEAVREALELAPNLPEAHLALGFFYDLGYRDYEQALREFAIAEQTLADDPYFIEVTAYTRRRMGAWQEAVARFERLVERDPRNVDLLVQLGVTLSMLRDYAAADRNIARALELAPDDASAYYWHVRIPWARGGDISLLKQAAENPPMPMGDFGPWFGWFAAIYERNYDMALSYLQRWETDAFSVQGTYRPKSLLYGITYQLAGRDELAQPEFQAALARIETELRASPEDPRIHIALALTLTGLGEFEAASAAARRGMRIMPRSRDDMSGAWYQRQAIVGVFAPAGDVDAVVEELDALLATPSNWAIEGLLPDPRFDPVRDDPRFQAIVEKYQRQ